MCKWSDVTLNVTKKEQSRTQSTPSFGFIFVYGNTADQAMLQRVIKKASEVTGCTRMSAARLHRELVLDKAS